METYLITGGAGFIGSNLTNYLVKEHKVVVIDDLSMGQQENLKPSANLTFIKGDVTDRKLMKEIITTNEFDYIFHLAAIASVADSVERPVETHQVNFESVLMLLELAKEHQKNMKRLVFSSSAAVYGDEPTLPKTEESVIRPLTPYAIDKFAAERFVLTYSKLYNVPTSAVRFFNVFGPNQNPKSPYSGVISILVDQFKRRLRDEETLFSVYGDGKQSRDFIYVDDVVQALLLVSKSMISLGEVYNVGTGNETDLNELIMMISEILEVELLVSYEKARVGDIPKSLADITKLKSINFKSNYSVKEGLENYLKNI
ncbi:NAD-dependent epimerase/dehydratase family protein [Vagococcus sp. PNs007]|uniref:NAD-dependent epimerase/dehydratase family protein n=1 Tax=Vagococcus proximus TaxID=2991417 RepID=A0ABT5WZZ1_9ENTE|nr:NAD-dependent epimerase/dehydratase family protein [Vagococcus proximus]MDF0479328.1 NAD-dependent epimerase/dehydratase family protein [Vagococcus proximus]